MGQRRNPSTQKKSSNTRSIYFNVDGIEPVEGYVVWIDMMGAASIMKRSLKMSMNFIGRIHIAALLCKKHNKIDLYPVMDGFYVYCKDEDTVKKFIDCVFEKIFNYFKNSKLENRFLLRGSIAYGKVYKGNNITSKNNHMLGTNDYKNSLLVGMPVIQAYETERLAPPFGVYVHESARFAGDFPFTWYRWFKNNNYNCYWVEIKKYFEWSAKIPNMLDYPKEKIEEHRSLAKEFFN